MNNFENTSPRPDGCPGWIYVNYRSFENDRVINKFAGVALNVWASPSRRKALICLMQSHDMSLGWDLEADFDYEPKGMLGEILDIHCARGDDWVHDQQLFHHDGHPPRDDGDPREAEEIPFPSPQDFGLN
jgi:hypothetical protein